MINELLMVFQVLVLKILKRDTFVLLVHVFSFIQFVNVVIPLFIGVIFLEHEDCENSQWTLEGVLTWFHTSPED